MKDQAASTVTWRDTPCFPLAQLCGIPSVTGGYDPRGRPPNGQTIVDGAGFRWVPIEGTAPQLDITGTWEDTPCPGTTMMAPASTGPQRITRNATQQMRRTGLMSEAELEDMGADPEVVLTSRPGTCRGIPSVVVDPRGQCQPTDPGGGFQDDNTNRLSDSTDTPDSEIMLGNLVEKVIKTVTLNQLATCPACQRRKEVLNRYGSIVGRAILRRLNW